MKEVCHLGGKAWAAINAACISKCWDKGLGPAFSSCVDTDESIADDSDDDDSELDFEGFTEEDVRESERLFAQLFDKEDLLQWQIADNDCPTYEHLTDSEIVRNVTSAPTEVSQSVTSSEPPEEDEEPELPPPKITEAIGHFEAGLRWLETQEVDHFKVLQLRSILDFARKQRHARHKQGTLDSFITKH